MPGLRARDHLVDVALQDSFLRATGGVSIGRPFRRESFHDFGSVTARNAGGVAFEMLRSSPTRARKMPDRPISKQLIEKGAEG